MTRIIPTLAATFLMAAAATPVFAQAAVQEPGAYAFYHPNADVLAGRQSYRSFDSANAYYNGGIVGRETLPRNGAIVSRHHRQR